MGETLDEFIALTKQYATDINTVYESYQETREQIGQEIGEVDMNEEIKEAIGKVKEAANTHFDQMMALTKTYLENIAELPEGEHPEQNKPGEPEASAD
jgi:NAD(P)H-nitrite reductase large subunit